MKTSIRLRLTDAIGHWREKVGTRLHHRLLLADALSGPSRRLVSRGRPRIPFVAARNVVIDNNLRLSNREICQRLDLEFPSRDGFVPGMPESWTERLGVSSYREAYKRCRRCLDSLIAKRRRISKLP